MARKIGIVSFEPPNHARVLPELFKEAKLMWFSEIEGLIAYLFQDGLDEIGIDENLFLERPFLIKKYCAFIAQVRPNICVKSVKVIRHNEGQELNGGEFFPFLETLFKDGELISVFQPIVEPGMAIEIFGYECLSRIRYQNSYFTPEFLFNYAQEKLLLCMADKICLMQALSFVPKNNTKLIFLNIRPQTMISEGFTSWLRDLVKKSHVNSECVVLEITEQHCIILEHEMKSKIAELKKLGFRMAIDDFGSGISNFSMLEMMRPDFIKISGRFIKGSPYSRTKEKIIKNIINIAQDFNIKVVVESVEHHEEWQLAKKLGAHLAQGFHFYKPMANVELLTLL